MKPFDYFRNRRLSMVEYTLGAVLLMAFAALIWVYVLLAQNRNRANDNSRAIAHAREVLLLGADLKTALATLESAGRGYIITRRDEYLAPMETARREIFLKTGRLTAIVGGNPEQFRRMQSLRLLLITKLRFSDSQVAAAGRGNGKTARTLTLTGKGLRITGAIGRLLLSVRSTEEVQLEKQMAANAAGIARANRLTGLLGTLLGTCLVISVTVSGAALHNRRKAETLARETSAYFQDVLHHLRDGVIAINSGLEPEFCNPAAEKIFGRGGEYLARGQHDQLSVHDPEQRKVDFREEVLGPALAGASTENLQVFATTPVIPAGRHLSVSAGPLPVAGEKSALLVVHDVTDRQKITQKLVEANKELDAFCYSVSHDLRAPLRSVTAFTQILQQDYGAKLDAEAARLCEVIVKNAEKMGRLIDDLLKFSRVSKQELIRHRVNLTRLSADIADRLNADSGRRTEVTVKPMPEAHCDAELATQLLYNLLSNAFKYSAKQSSPSVEVGATESDGEVVYYVRDNGAGFDMRYYGKLFDVFQRLHSEREFEGTGVGLSIVHRIIARHGGRIWANSSPGRGAAFYFTLPEHHETFSNHETHAIQRNPDPAH